MKRFSPINGLLGLCCLLLPAWGAAASVPSEPGELIRASRKHFLEGQTLIRSGDAEGAREHFDEAVDMLLDSEWDLGAHPEIAPYFQELIQEIKDCESRYLYASVDIEEEAEIIEGYGDLDLDGMTDDPVLQAALTASIAEHQYDIPITVNEMVVRSLEYFLNRGRKHFEAGLVRSGQYREMIETIFLEEGLPLDLINLAQVESHFKVHALSRTRARGIWQFMEGTAVRYGLKVNRDIDERSDPEKATRAAARYLKDLYDMFGDWNLSLAAYNWGEGKVKRLIESTGIRDFWQLAKLGKRLPKETMNHVPLILASTILSRNAEKYGLPVELDPPLRYQKIAVSKPIDLRAAARTLDITFDEIRRLNPALKGVTTPANDPGFQLRVPEGVDADAEVRIAALPRARVDRGHRVRQGETLSGIARRYKTTVRALMRTNNLASANRIRAGQMLRLPLDAEGGSGDEIGSADRASAGSHRVRPGETLSGIARRYGTTVEALRRANNLGSRSMIKAGATLRLPSATALEREESPVAAQEYRHQVRPGETLSGIARRYGTTVEALRRANNLDSRSTIKAGAWLLVPPAHS